MFSLKSWVRGLQAARQPNRTPIARSGRHSFRPRFESLEDRLRPRPSTLAVTVRSGVSDDSGFQAIVNQLNDDTYSDFQRLPGVVAQVDTLAELIRLRRGGDRRHRPVDQQRPVRQRRLHIGPANLGGPGHGLVATRWGPSTAPAPAHRSPTSTPSSRSTPASYGYYGGGTVVQVTGPTHPVTAGVPSFQLVSGDFVEFFDRRARLRGDGLATTNGWPTVVAGQAGARAAAYLGPIFSGYSVRHRPLRSGPADRLLEQAVAWAAGEGRYPRRPPYPRTTNVTCRWTSFESAIDPATFDHTDGDPDPQDRRPEPHRRGRDQSPRLGQHLPHRRPGNEDRRRRGLLVLSVLGGGILKAGGGGASGTPPATPGPASRGRLRVVEHHPLGRQHGHRLGARPDPPSTFSEPVPGGHGRVADYGSSAPTARSRSPRPSWTAGETTVTLTFTARADRRHLPGVRRRRRRPDRPGHAGRRGSITAAQIHLTFQPLASTVGDFDATATSTSSSRSTPPATSCSTTAWGRRDF